jgi:protocatechuate 3,4-dioxygenase beta subunit
MLVINNTYDKHITYKLSQVINIVYSFQGSIVIRKTYARDFYMSEVEIKTGRRNFVTKLGIGGIAGVIMSKSSAELCQLFATPTQPLGPFYPKKFPLDSDADLTQLQGHAQAAKGRIILVKGVVTDEYCHPLGNVIVEAWQACANGRYNHPSDTSDNELDQHFQYYGMVKTNQKGEFSFKTIYPGAYDASQDWRRPPHIHFKVSMRGFEQLVTQCYFSGEDLNAHDRILQKLNLKEQDSVTVNLINDQGEFNIQLKKL